MGVFHFMGLGRSVGVVTAAANYLGHRLERWDPADQEFFALSGERRQQAEKRGDAQALVLFTTPEVHNGEVLAFGFLDNPAGQEQGPEHPAMPMLEALRALMKKEVRRFGGGRSAIELYCCLIDRANLRLSFERVVRVMRSARQPGQLGKEVWINSTGGSNVVNLALHLAAGLTAIPARNYYLQASNDRLVRSRLPPAQIGTSQDDFWVDLPIVHLEFNQALQAVMSQVEKGEVLEEELLSCLKGRRGLAPVRAG